MSGIMRYFNTMLFGLSGAERKITTLMQRVHRSTITRIDRNYLDDVVIEGHKWKNLI